jgi:ABC-type Fe3+-hydroxamate transport system substrate-binding protein
MRIISLVPSLTEYLWALGLEQEVVGITKFCIHPQQWWKTKTRVGGTKKLNFEVLEALEPTLVIANKEENTKEDIARLQQNYPVLLTDINTLDDAFYYLLEIGHKVNRMAQAQALVAQIKRGFQELGPVANGASFLYFIWKDPYFVVGPNTYINALLSHFGLQNYCSIERYPALDELMNQPAHSNATPDLIFLSSEPYPFKDEHVSSFQKQFPNSKVRLIDGEMCSWYGSRMLLVPAYLKRLFLE